MSFIKKIWKKGDKITSAALNRIEDALETVYGPLEAEATLASDSQTGKMIVALNKTAGELYEAACAGKQLKLSMSVTNHDAKADVDYVVNITRIFSFAATKMVVEYFGAVVYNFEARIGDSDDGDKLLCSADIDENDTVVLTEV